MPYHVLGQEGLNGGLIRLAIYGLTLLATVGFLALVPKRNLFFTKWGTRSIYIYLLHGFFIQYFRNSEWVSLLNDPWQFSILIIAAFLLTAFLSSNFTKAITQPFIECTMIGSVTLLPEKSCFMRMFRVENQKLINDLTLAEITIYHHAEQLMKGYAYKISILRIKVGIFFLCFYFCWFLSLFLS